ncbi:MAG: TolC family protein [Kofleriaceae bacterium]|nr:TolC family protein [Kofleriaceae bacterium]
MRLARGLAFALLVVASASTRGNADPLWRLMELAQDGGGGGGSPATTRPSDLSGWAGPARLTSLPDLLQHAVRNAPALQTARIDISIAEAQIAQTYARDNWQLRGEVLGSSRSTFFGGFTIDRSTVVTGNLDIARMLPTGGTVTFHAGTQYQRATSPLSGEPATNWFDEVSVSFSQPLLRGRGRWLYESNERRAEISRDVSVLQRRLVAIQAIQTVVSAYWDLVLAERQIAITQASLDLANKRLELTTLGNQGGKIPRSEIPAVQQIIATREEEMLGAELGVLERSIAVRRATGLPIGAGELGLRVGADLETRDITLDLGQLTERAWAASPELAQLAKRGSVALLDIQVTENGLLPQLDAALTLGPMGQDDKFTGALENLVKLKSIAVGGSLTYQRSFGQEDVRGRAREIREQRRRLEVSAVDVRAQIAQTMARAVAQLELAKRRLALSQRAIDLAKENIQIETDRFNLGKATNFDVLNRSEELRQAELRKAQAMIDWHKAEAVIDALTGDILPRYGITLD